MQLAYVAVELTGISPWSQRTPEILSLLVACTQHLTYTPGSFTGVLASYSLTCVAVFHLPIIIAQPLLQYDSPAAIETAG